MVVPPGPTNTAAKEEACANAPAPLLSIMPALPDVFITVPEVFVINALDVTISKVPVVPSRCVPQNQQQSQFLMIHCRFVMPPILLQREMTLH